jgi:hypothetical protein
MAQRTPNAVRQKRALLDLSKLAARRGRDGRRG